MSALVSDALGPIVWDKCAECGSGSADPCAENVAPHDFHMCLNIPARLIYTFINQSRPRDDFFSIKTILYCLLP